MGKTALYIASSLISAVVLVSVVVLTRYEIVTHDIPSSAYVSPALAMFAAFIMPYGEATWSRLRMSARGLALAAILGSLAYKVWHMSREDVADYLTYGAVGVLAIGAILVLSGAGKFAFAKWQAITPPRVRLIVGASVVAVGIAATLAFFVLYMGWRNILANLDLLLVVVYLPVVGGIAGLLYLRRTLGKRKAAAGDKD